MNRLYYEWKRLFRNDWNLFPRKTIAFSRMYELFEFDPEWYKVNKAFLDAYSIVKSPTGRELSILANIFGTDKMEINIWFSQR